MIASQTLMTAAAPPVRTLASVVILSMISTVTVAAAGRERAAPHVRLCSHWVIHFRKNTLLVVEMHDGKIKHSLSLSLSTRRQSL